MILILGVTAAQAGFLADLPPVTPDGNADRADIPDVYKWDLTDLYPDAEAWSAALDAARAELVALAELHGALREPTALASYLSRYYDLELAGNRVTLYAYLGSIPDTTDQTWIARHKQALALTNDIMSEGTVLRRAVLALSEPALEAAYLDIPGFESFRPAIEALRRRADRVLDPEAERILSLAGDNLWAAIDINELPSPLEQTFSAIVSEMPLPKVTDEDGSEVQLTFANYPSLRASADRRVREDAVHGMFSALKEFENTFAATLGGQAQLDVLFARARHYDTAVEAYLDKDDLDPAVYQNLIDTVRAHTPALHRYVDLRKKALGLDEVHLYDLYIPLVEGVEKKMTYAEGADTILTALAPLGSDYQAAVRWLLEPATGAVDVYPSRHKDSGASSSSVYGVHPYLKMNFLNRLDDVSTLAHELGHAVHTHLTNTHQPYLTSRYTMVLAETASTCNEMLLSKYLVANATSDAERAWLLSELVEGIRQTIYRQTLFAEFELKVHALAEAGEPITADRLNEIYAGLIHDYYGPGYTVDSDDGIEWAYIPHFYYKYYVYSYAVGMASAIDIAERVSAGKRGAAAAYLEMLSSGNSKPPVELLKGAGVDLTDPASIATALDVFDQTLSELEKLIAK